MRELQPWITLVSEEVFAVPNRVRLIKEQVQLPDGKVVDDFYQIQLLEYVVVFAQTLFMVSGAHKIKDPDCDDLEEIEVRLMTQEEVVQAVFNAEVATLASVATIALALNPQFVK